jgi:hypothetical protein
LPPAATSDSLYGSFPPSLLDPQLEHCKELVDSHAELAGAQQSLDNAFKLYLKTR